MTHRVAEVLIGADALAERVTALAAEVRAAAAPEAPLFVVGVLRGSFVFMADLVRALRGDVRCGFVQVRSYQGTTSVGEVELLMDVDEDLSGQHVVVVEDIVDTGLTVQFLRDYLGSRGPASLQIVSLLDKPSRRQVPVAADHVGFTIPDRFVVGYGLDYLGLYRNLPHIAVLEEGERG